MGNYAGAAGQLAASSTARRPTDAVAVNVEAFIGDVHFKCGRAMASNRDGALARFFVYLVEEW